MKFPTTGPQSVRRATLALFVALAAVNTLSANNLTWDTSANGATIDAGSGIWDTTSTNLVWNDAGSNVAWTQSNATTALHSAQFAGADAPLGTTYTITLGSSVAVNTTNSALRFSSNGYILTAAAGSSNIITTRQITTDAGKIATIGGPITLSLLNITNVNQFNGSGTLIAKDGVKITPAGNPTFGIGSNLKLQTGSAFTSVGSVIVGGQSTDGSSTRVTVEGGSLNISGSNIALVLANVNSTSAQYSDTIVTLSSGNITNASSGGGIRFGGSSPTAGNNSNVNGTLNLDGGVLTTARLYETNGTVSSSYNSTINFNGGTLRAQSNTANGATFLQGLNTANIKAGGAIIDTNGANITIGQALLGEISGNVSTGGGLTKLGNGTLTFTGNNTYTGNTTVSAGTLEITAPYSALSSTNVAPAARLRISAGATPSVLPALTLQGDSGVDLNLGVYSVGSLSTASFTTFNPAGDYKIDLSGTNILVGNYTVFTYGSKTGTGVPTLGSLPPGVTATVSDSAGVVSLNVTTPQLTNYIWSVDSGIWDTTTPTNWSPGAYVEGGVVTFPNRSGNLTVTLSADRSPFAIAIQNNINNGYTFTGSAISGNATVAKTGTGFALLSASNTYAGATSVSSGNLLVSADGALGSPLGKTTISSGAALVLADGVNYSTAEPLIVSGSGYGSATVSDSTPKGGVIGLRGAVQALSGNVTFVGPIQIGAGGARFGVQNVVGASLTLSGTISPAAGVTDSSVYFRAGNEAGNYIILSGAGNYWDKTASIYCNPASGTSGVRLGVDNAMSINASVVAGGTFTSLATTLDLNGFNQTLPGLVESDGYLQIANLKAGTTSVLTLDTALADYTTVAGLNNLEAEFTTISDGSGTTALVKKGAFKQTLDGVQTYSGPTTIEAGTLAIIGTGFLQPTPITMWAGATLDVSTIGSVAVPRTTFDLSGGLSGSGNLTASGKTVTVSTTFAPGALAVSGNLTLAVGTATTLVASTTPGASSVVTVTDGTLTLAGNLAINPAGGFAFATGQSFTFATGTIVAGLNAVSVASNALSGASGVWTATIGGLVYTFTESTATLTVSGGDTTPPVIGAVAPVSVNWGSSYSDVAPNATDETAPANPIVTTTGTVNTAKPGTYTLTYNAQDAAGNNAVPVQRTVSVSIDSSTTVHANGFAPLMKYALGAISPSETVQAPVAIATSTTLSISAVVRIDDPNLAVSAESSTDLMSWSPVTLASVDTLGLPSNLERRVYTVTIAGARQFLRLKAVLLP